MTNDNPFFEAPPEPEITYHRRSALCDASECPFKFRTCLDREGVTQNEFTRLGIAGHKIMADYMAELRHNAEWSCPEYLVSEAEKAEPHYAQELTDILRRCATSIRYPPNDILAIERTFKTTNTMPPGQGYCQTLDLLWRKDDALMVDDWKFGFKEYSDSTAHNDRQARWACWLLSVQPEYKDVQLFNFRFRMMRYGAKTATATFTRPQLSNCPMHIGMAIIDLMRGNKEPIPGPWCAYPCPVINDCPLLSIRHPDVVNAIDLSNSPKDYAEYVYVLQERVGAMKRAASVSRQASKDKLVAQYQRDILNCETRDEAIMFIDKIHAELKDVVAEGRVMDAWIKENT